MASKVIIDCDPGIDDACALILALLDKRVDVVAVTAVAGNVSAERSSLNVQTIIEQLDPPRLPRIGVAQMADEAPATDSTPFHGKYGLGDAEYPTTSPHHRHPSDKLICDEVRAAPHEVTLLCLGPLTNVARALQRDPELESLIQEIVVVGGAVACGGDVTPAAEFNIYYDSVAARSVFRSNAHKRLIPLDVTNRVSMTYGMLDELPKATTRVGGLLRKMLPFTFRAHRQLRGEESVKLPGLVGLLALLHPELFESQEMAGDVELRGDLTKGETVFDRRAKRIWRDNLSVAMQVDTRAIETAMVRCLIESGRHG
jgi:inosine-uridine nucleoside N-ribohydrolase